MNAKVKAIVSHIFFIGWVISFVVNLNDKEEYASYYIRQNLGLLLAGLAVGLFNGFPIIGWLVSFVGGILVFVFWLMSLIWSISGEMKPVPWVGQYFQDWFRTF
jgi:uncharacterized membrane protein